MIQITIRRFSRKTRRYTDAYRKGLNAHEPAFAVKKYNSHRRVRLTLTVTFVRVPMGLSFYNETSRVETAQCGACALRPTTLVTYFRKKGMAKRDSIDIATYYRMDIDVSLV